MADSDVELEELDKLDDIIQSSLAKPVNKNSNDDLIKQAKTATTNLSTTYQNLTQLENLISSNEHHLLKIKNLKYEIYQAEQQLNNINFKIEKTKKKYEDEIGIIERNRTKLAKQKSDLEAGLCEMEESMDSIDKNGSYRLQCEEIKNKQKELSSQLRYIFPTNASMHQFLDVKIPLKPELTIHSSRLASYTSPTSKSKSHSKTDELVLTSFTGENLAKLLLAQSYIYDTSLRYPVLTLQNQYSHESGAVIRDYNEKNLKLSSYSRRDRSEFLNAMAMVHCDFFDIEWVFKHKCVRRVLTKGHGKNLWKIVESCFDDETNSGSEFVSSSPSSLNTSPLNKGSGPNFTRSVPNLALKSELNDDVDEASESALESSIFQGQSGTVPGQSTSSSNVGLLGNRKNRLVDRSKLFG